MTFLPLTPLVFALVLASTTMADEADAVEVNYENGRYKIRLESVLDAPIDAVYKVLTDYDRLTELDPHIRESRLLSGNGVGAEVYTRIRGCVLFFCRTIERVVHMTEVPPNYVSAKLVPERSNITDDEFSWSLTAKGNMTRALYEQEIEPGFWVPPMIGPAIVRSKLRRTTKNAMQNLEQKAKEIGAE